jgi:hypothetical protein
VALSLRRWHGDARQAPPGQGAVDEAAQLANPLAALAVDTVNQIELDHQRWYRPFARVAWAMGTAVILIGIGFLIGTAL